MSVDTLQRQNYEQAPIVSNRVPFSSLPTIMIVGSINFDPRTNIKTSEVFQHIPIFEIEGYSRGKNVKVKIPHPGVPFVILAAKLGRQTRGIQKKIIDPAKVVGNKGKFGNTVLSLDLSLNDKVVNAMVFSNYVKVTGGSSVQDSIDTATLLRAYLMMLHRKGHNVFDHEPVVSKIGIVMQNVFFSLGHNVNKEVLIQKALETGAQSANEKDAARVLYPMGIQKKKGGERYYDFRIQHTGSVMFNGDTRENMEIYYNKFMDIIEANKAAISF